MARPRNVAPRLFATALFWRPGDYDVKEYKGTTDENVADMKNWYADYVADRRRRGVPTEGLPLYGGIRSIEQSRQMIGAMKP